MLDFQEMLSNAPRIEKLKLWMRMQHPRLSFNKLALPLQIQGQTLARNCANETMPVRQHEYLVKTFDVPVEYLPIPLDVKTGPKPKSPAAE